MGAPTYDNERALIAEGRRLVAGVDEVGRGPLAGPVGVGAVILDPDDLPEGLDDSKALSAARREALAEAVYARAIAVSLAFASVEEIDRFNIRGATLLAMRRAVAALSVKPDYRADRRPRHAARPRLPGASDHRRRRIVAVDRRRFDRRQSRARRADGAARRGPSRLWLRAPCGLSDRANTPRL